jgi:hypothetical protein
MERFLFRHPDRQKAYYKEYAQKNRERIRGRQRLKNYGISAAEWDSLFLLQGSKCAICGATEPGGKRGWHGDHDHATNKFRGILCHICNVMLGHARDDSSILASAIEYLNNPPFRK